MSVRQVWKCKTSTPKSSPPSQNDSPPLPPRVYLQSPSPPSYNPLRDQMINQLHNISTILDSHNNPSNAYIHAPPSPPPPQIHPPSHAQTLEQALPSPEYVPDPMELEDHVPVYVSEPDYPEYLAPSEDDIPVKDQPLPADASPVALSPGYIADSDPEEDGEDLADYPADAGDDDDDESSVDNDDDDDDVEEDEEEEEHLAHADSTAIASLAVDYVPFAKETKTFETDESAATPPPPPAYHTTPRMYVRTQTPIPFPSEEEVARLIALLTPPPSPLTPLSSPPTSPTYAQAPLGCRAAMMRATPSPIPLPQSFLPSPIRPPHTRAAMTQMRDAALSTNLSLLPAGTPPLLPILLPAPSTSHGADIPEADILSHPDNGRNSGM
ncbi:hypothetical protein Tco_0744348 [Tanacetum coccineum]